MSFVRKVVAWLLPLLGLVFAVSLPWWLLARGVLKDPESAFTVGASVVIAEFTMALWWATQAQARATEGMRRLEEKLVLLEKAPVVVISDIAFSGKVRSVGLKEGGIGVLGDTNRSSMEVRFTASNVGRYGLVIKTAALFVLEDGGVYHPIRLLPEPEGGGPVVAPGRSAVFRMGNNQAHEHAYQLFRAIESCPVAHNRISEAWSCVGLAVEVVHGGSLGEGEWLCFKLGLGAKTGDGYRAAGYQSACPQNVIARANGAKLLV